MGLIYVFIESRNIKKDLEMFSNCFKVGNIDLGTIIEKLVPVVDEAYSVIEKYLENNSLENKDISIKNVTVTNDNILSVEENI